MPRAFLALEVWDLIRESEERRVSGALMWGLALLLAMSAVLAYLLASWIGGAA